MVAAVYLMLAWVAVAVIDIYNVAGLRATLGRDEGAPAWVHLFGEGGLTEMLQWLILATLALVAAARAEGLKHLGDARGARFFGLLAVLAVLMLIEDAGNPSHRLSVYGQDIFGTTGGFARALFRMPVFLALGGLAIYAFARYWKLVIRGKPGSRILMGGFGAYGLAVFSSLPAHLLFDFYGRAGPWLTETVLNDRLIEIDVLPHLEGEMTASQFTSVMFMDFVYEESIELIGAALLLAGSLALGAVLAADQDTNNGQRGAPEP